MKRILKTLLLMSLVLSVLALIGGTAVWHTLIAQPDVSISINGEDMGVQSFSAVPWFGAVIGMFAAGLVICVVLPLMLLLGLGLPLLIMGLVLGCMMLGLFSVGALLFSPLILPVLLLWLLLRRKSKPAPARNMAA